MDYVIVGVAAFLVSTVSAIAGGGGGLVMTPLMLLLGFPPQTVLASAKAGGIAINVGALSKFIRQKKLINWRWAAWLSAVAIFASLLGTRLVFVASPGPLKHLIVAITLLLAVVLLLERKIGLSIKHVSKKHQLIGAGAYFIIMALQSGLGSGIGMLLMFVMMGLLGFDALGASATKRVPGLVLVIASFVIFAFSDYMNWALAGSLAAGMLLGGYIGAGLAIKHGNKLVKNALIVVSVAMVISLLFTE